jgi:hypothetical protein
LTIAPPTLGGGAIFTEASRPVPLRALPFFLAARKCAPVGRRVPGTMNIQRLAAFSDGYTGGNPAGVVIVNRLPAASDHVITT